MSNYLLLFQSTTSGSRPIFARRNYGACIAASRLRSTLTRPGAIIRDISKGCPELAGELYSLLPPENATGNYVKVVQRLPVRIRLNRGRGSGPSAAPGYVGGADRVGSKAVHGAYGKR